MRASLAARAVAAAISAALAAGCAVGGRTGPLPEVSAPASIVLTSPGFQGGAPIPVQHTCDGQGLPPRLQWTESEPAAEFVLIVTDPDAPGGTFVHWVVYGIPGNADSLGEGQAPSGSIVGSNDFDQIGYGAPCPPPGDDAHRYVFTIYGLSDPTTASVPRGATAEDVLEAIRCCVEATGRLVGTYRR